MTATDTHKSGSSEPIDAERHIRLYIQMDCSEPDALIAGKLFNDFRKDLIDSFPQARIKDRQYDRSRVDNEQPGEASA
ncbi:MAG: hypothetical protein AAFX54_17860 [Pseudomonadota bacterium]